MKAPCRSNPIAPLFLVPLFAAIAPLAALRAQSDYATPYTFTTLAGDAEYSSADGTGSSAFFFRPGGVAVDGGGNVYVADSGNNTVRKITPAGIVTTFAGIAGSFGATDGTGSVARFNSPTGVAVDGSGNVYVADRNSSTIRKITPAGAVTTIAGTAGSHGSTDGEASAAQFNHPCSVAVDTLGNVYVADSGSHTVRKIDADGMVTTLAGTAGNIGANDGIGGAARFNIPYGVAVGGSGDIYVTDHENDTIRKVTSAGVVTTIAGAASSNGFIDGIGSAARFAGPMGVAVDGSGNIYVADYWGHTIRKISSGSVVVSFAGSGNGNHGSADGLGSAARFELPVGLAVDGLGNVYVADAGNSMIRKITPVREVTTLAGWAGTFDSVDGTGSAARFAFLDWLATDGVGNVFLTEANSYNIRKITPAGEVSTFAGMANSSGSIDGVGSAARFSSPNGLAVDDAGNLYVSDNRTIRKITPAGMVTTLAGAAGVSGTADGTGSAARFNTPSGVTVDGAGNVYVADSLSYTIRKITPAGVVTTFAGTAGIQGLSDGTGSAALFYWPRGIASDHSGNVYVSEVGTSHIRKITPVGEVTTLAGAINDVGSTDGPVTQARFNHPHGLSVDGAGNIYVADYENHAIRRITSAGIVSTLGGFPGAIGSADGTGSVARFYHPSGVAVDGAGHVYVADADNHTIRKGAMAIIAPSDAIITFTVE